MLHILLRVIAAHLCQASDAGSHARFGAVSFIHRFGSSLNRHVHYPCCVIDGVFEPVKDAGDVPEFVRLRPAAELTPEAVAAIAEQVRVRVLRWFARRGLIDPGDAREMLAWENSGSSLDAAVWFVSPRTIMPVSSVYCAIAPARPMSGLSNIAADSSRRRDVSYWPVSARRERALFPFGQHSVR
ncbi:MAG: transposase [Thiohalocapsa sp.]